MRSNTEILADKIIEGMRTIDNKIFVDKINLTEKNIEPCTGCGYCEKNPECIIKDDMEEIYKKIYDSEIVIIASPLYFANVSAQTKAFIDRGQIYFNGMYFRKEPIIPIDKKKIGIAVSSAGGKYPKQFDGFEATLTYFFKGINAELSEKIYASETDGIPIEMQYDILKEAYEIGKRTIKNV